MKMISLLLIGIGISVLVALTTNAQELNVEFTNSGNETIMDARVSGSTEADLNFGTGEYIAVRRGSSAGVMRSYIMFALNRSIFPSSSNISEAYLILGTGTTASPAESTFTDSIHEVNSTFDETTITFNNQPCGITTDSLNASQCNATETGSKSVLNNNNAPVNTTFNVTLAIRNAIKGNRTNITLVIKSQTENQGSTDAHIFVAREFTGGTNPNRIAGLNITFFRGTDEVAPTMKTGFNGTFFPTSSVINMTANVSDTGVSTLSFCQFVVNKTGFKEFYNISVEGLTSSQCSQNFSIPQAKGTLVNFSIIANDSIGNKRQFSELITIGDVILPDGINMTVNTTILNQGTMVNISANVSDDRELSFCQFLVNDTSTGAYLIYNQSIGGTGDRCSQNISISTITGVLNFTVRVNDSGNNFNQNETLFAINDNDLPTLKSINFSAQSITDGSQINLTINTSDASSNLQTIRFNFSNPNKQNFTRVNPTNFAIPTTPDYILNYTFFSGSETSIVGIWNLTAVYITDLAGNVFDEYPNITFTINAVDTGGGGSSGGGGGGSSPPPVIIINATNASDINCNFNQICETGEDPFSCQTDCKVNTDYLFCDDPTKPCIKDTLNNLFNSRNPIFRISLIVAIFAIIIIFFVPKGSAVYKLFAEPFVKNRKGGK